MTSNPSPPVPRLLHAEPGANRTAALARQVEELRSYVRRLEGRGGELSALLREREQAAAVLRAECDRMRARNEDMRAHLASRAHRAADRVAGLFLRLRRLLRCCG